MRVQKATSKRCLVLIVLFVLLGLCMAGCVTNKGTDGTDNNQPKLGQDKNYKESKPSEAATDEGPNKQSVMDHVKKIGKIVGAVIIVLLLLVLIVYIIKHELRQVAKIGDLEKKLRSVSGDISSIKSDLTKMERFASHSSSTGSSSDIYELKRQLTAMEKEIQSLKEQTRRNGMQGSYSTASGYSNNSNSSLPGSNSKNGFASKQQDFGKKQPIEEAFNDYMRRNDQSGFMSRFNSVYLEHTNKDEMNFSGNLSPVFAERQEGLFVLSKTSNDLFPAMDATIKGMNYELFASCFDIAETGSVSGNFKIVKPAKVDMISNGSYRLTVKGRLEI